MSDLAFPSPTRASHAPSQTTILSVSLVSPYCLLCRGQAGVNKGGPRATGAPFLPFLADRDAKAWAVENTHGSQHSARAGRRGRAALHAVGEAAGRGQPRSGRRHSPLSPRDPAEHSTAVSARGNGAQRSRGAPREAPLAGAPASPPRVGTGAQRARRPPPQASRPSRECEPRRLAAGPRPLRPSPPPAGTRSGGPPPGPRGSAPEPGVSGPRPARALRKRPPASAALRPPPSRHVSRHPDVSPPGVAAAWRGGRAGGRGVPSCGTRR